MPREFRWFHPDIPPTENDADLIKLIQKQFSIRKLPSLIITDNLSSNRYFTWASSAEEIFNRFAKLDSFKQGSGLGLNICRVIAGKLGGKVDIDRNYGRCADPQAKGARFVFILPLTASTE